MSAELLREAAAKARRWGTSPLGDDFNDPRHIAVADLLDHAATHQVAFTPNVRPLLIDVARAYLGPS